LVVARATNRFANLAEATKGQARRFGLIEDLETVFRFHKDSWFVVPEAYGPD
jgi:hypothetical protein